MRVAHLYLMCARFEDKVEELHVLSVDLEGVFLLIPRNVVYVSITLLQEDRCMVPDDFCSKIMEV